MLAEYEDLLVELRLQCQHLPELRKEERTLSKQLQGRQLKLDGLQQKYARMQKRQRRMRGWTLLRIRQMLRGTYRRQLDWLETALETTGSEIADCEKRVSDLQRERDALRQQIEAQEKTAVLCRALLSRRAEELI